MAFFYNLLNSIETFYGLHLTSGSVCPPGNMADLRLTFVTSRRNGLLCFSWGI